MDLGYTGADADAGGMTELLPANADAPCSRATVHNANAQHGRGKK